MRYNVFLVFLLLCFSCKETEARRPKTHTTNNFYKELLEKNKKLNKIEERNIKLLLSKDTIHNYQISNAGFWYRYIKKDTFGTVYPKTDDVVILKYSITDVFDNVIYDEKQVSYKVDKEDFIAGLNDGIKLMKEGEEAMFIIPSYRAYGVTGDGNKIGMNKTIKSKLQIIEIKQNQNENN